MPADGVWLYWLPLGAGGHLVRFNGRVYEAVTARLERRPPEPLLHSALEVRLAGQRWVVEMTPVWGNTAPDRGVVVRGAVGARVLGHSKLFRYEVRRWRDGTIGDVAEAIGGPRALSGDAASAGALLALVPLAPAATWGRDELRTGEMWNSNSLVSWLLAGSGHDPTSVRAPGRAPGWRAGLVVAARSGADRANPAGTPSERS